MSTRYELRLSDNTDAELRACAEREGCTRAALVARAIHLWAHVRIKHRGAELVMRQAGTEEAIPFT